MPLLDLQGFIAVRPVKQTLTFHRGKRTRVDCADGSVLNLRLSGDIYEVYGDGETVTLEAGELLRLRFTEGRIVGRDLPSEPPPQVTVPDADAWEPRGVAVLKGGPSDWDARIHGAHAPASVVILPDGRIALYYVGSRGDRTSDGGPAFRALGVAISEDGLRPFTKHPQPVIEHFPQPSHPNAEEEGVFSCAAVVEGKTLYVYYGAIEATGPGSVDVFVHVAESTDGVTFTNHKRIPVTSRNGEIWPFTAVLLDGVHYVWIGRRDYIDVLSGFTPALVGQQRRSGLSPRETREIGSSLVDLGGGKIAMLYDDPMRIATAYDDEIQRWSSGGSYPFPEGDMGKCWLVHREAGHWLLYALHPDDQTIRIWSAPTR